MALVIGPGSLNVDVSAYAPRLPQNGETVMGSDVVLGPGGKGNNQMTAAHRAGAEALIIGAVGRDGFAPVLTEHYRREGMDTRYLAVSATAPTGTALIEIEGATAQNRIVVISGANREVTADSVRKAEADFARAGAVLCQFESPLEAVGEAKRMAKRYGIPFLLNPAPCVPVPDGFFEGVDYLTPNETEAEGYTGIAVDSPENAALAAEALHRMGARKVVITLGSRGAFFSDGAAGCLIPPFPVKAVDTTGAGDTFNGALAAAIAEGMPDEKALRFASAAAALAVSRKGAAESAPRRAEIEALL